MRVIERLETTWAAVQFDRDLFLALEAGSKRVLDEDEQLVYPYIRSRGTEFWYATHPGWFKYRVRHGEWVLVGLETGEVRVAVGLSGYEAIGGSIAPTEPIIEHFED
ncbi:MAG: hypothetical protein GY769_07825 [bacterium]|nr:hypothetical protein [bacterium]